MYIYLNIFKQVTNVKLLVLNSNTWNHLTESKELVYDCLKKCYQQNIYRSYSIHMY